MDPHKDSASIKKSLNVECDGEKNRNYKSNPIQQNVNSESGENPVTSTPNHSSGFVPLNSPETRPNNPLVSGEKNQTQNFIEHNTDSIEILAACSQSQLCKVNSNAEMEVDAASTSNNTGPNVCDNGLECNHDVSPCQRHKVCLDVAGNSCTTPSASGVIKSTDTTENNTFRENRKRPSSLKLNRPNVEDDSSSDTENDDYSLGSEDGCIYTYRGGEHLADLPSSFFSLDMGLPLDRHLPMLPNYQAQQQGNREHGSRASSPDMDFLEMDFDPGPSCEVDTDDESSPDPDFEAANKVHAEMEQLVRRKSPEHVGGGANNPVNVPAASTSAHDDTDVYSHNVPSTSQSGATQTDNAVSHAFGPYIIHTNVNGEQLLVRRTMAHCPATVPVSHHLYNGDLVPLKEILNNDEEHAEGPFASQINQGERPAFDSANMSSVVYHLTMAKKLMADKTKSETDTQPSGMVGEVSEPAAAPAPAPTSSACAEPPRRMVWSEQEACERQVTQIGTSACGATAVVNVFIALGVPVNIEKINSAVVTRQRANNAPIPRYLMSRAVAGCTAAELVAGIHRASDGLVTARFFPTHPERAVSLSHWLADWISIGAVPILTLNMQVNCEGEIPDAWHHQMVFGVSPRGVYLCNPVECVREGVVWARLTSPSVLLVRARDVVERFSQDSDLTPLMAVPDRRFHTFNVLGQVVNLVREWRSAGCTGWSVWRPGGGGRTRHLRIPAAYSAGVTLAALTGSAAHRRLAAAPPLPLLHPHTHNHSHQHQHPHPQPPSQNDPHPQPHSDSHSNPHPPPGSNDHPQPDPA